MPETIFISYRSLDSKKVDSIVAKLRLIKNDDGTPRYRVWQDKNREGDGIPPGADWWESILDAIEACSVFIFMISQESIKSVNCNSELNYAYGRNRHIIPVMLPGEFDYDDGKYRIAYGNLIPKKIQDLQFVFYDGHQAHEELVTLLERYVNNPNEDIVIRRPLNPDDEKEFSDLYHEACEFAWQTQFEIADEKFRKLMKRTGHRYQTSSGVWVKILNAYRNIDNDASKPHNQVFAIEGWKEYIQQFSNIAFIDGGIFDPKDFKSRYGDSVMQSLPTSLALPEIETLPPPKIITPTHKSLELMPKPFAWCDIPAGDVTIEKGGYLDKPTTFQVSAFQMSKYPITNAQYRLFMDAGGYAEKRWWTEEGWQAKLNGWTQKGSLYVKTGEAWTQPNFWDYINFNSANHPVVGVSWYEAVAFCQWMSAQTGENITLPTEQEWQWAAQGRDRSKYPWGNGFDKNRCNTQVAGIGKTTSVTHYEGKGDSPFGVVDISGNVWKWCLTGYETGSNNLTGNKKRITRGGSWNMRANFATTLYRLSGEPFNRYFSFGFFVVSR